MKQEKHEIRCSEIEKRLGKCRFFEKSYKNTRTKNSVSHLGYAIFDAPGGTRKGVKKTCQWHVFSPWESPFSFRYGNQIALPPDVKGIDFLRQFDYNTIS